MEGRVSCFFFASINIFLHRGRYQERITNQLRRLGGSYDWDRVAFTMNDVCCFVPWNVLYIYTPDLEIEQGGRRDFL